MRTSVFLASAFATLAFGTPVEPRQNSVVQDGDRGKIGVVHSLTVGRPVFQGHATSKVSSSDVAAETASIMPDEVESDDLQIRETGSSPTTENHPHQVRHAKVPVATLYRQAATQRHNLHRRNHGAPPVIWDSHLERAAMKAAKKCTFAHFMNENGLSYGQNLALGQPASNIAGIITDQWYSEVSAFGGDYGQSQPNYGSNMEDFEKWGHFTQVVWKSSAKIGCATWRCDSVATSETDSTPLPAAYGGDITYCNYQGAGNYADEYAANVGLPRSSMKVAAGHHVNEAAIAKSYATWTGQVW